MEGFRRCSEEQEGLFEGRPQELERRFLREAEKKGVGAENEMGWRGKYRDSSESAGGPRKKETPKVSGNGPCSLNIRSNPPAQPRPICVDAWQLCWVKENCTFGVWWEGCLSPRGCKMVFFFTFCMPRCYIFIEIFKCSVIIKLIIWRNILFTLNSLCVCCAY